MALTVQSVTNDSNFDTRQVIGNTGTGLTIFTGFIDRIHKDCLHSSLYSYLNLGVQSFNTVSGTPTYVLSGNIRRIQGVYDNTRDRVLFPIDRATSPVSQVEGQEPQPGGQNSAADAPKWVYPPLGALALQSGQPEFFRLVGSNNTIRLYPTPKQALLISVAFEQQVTTLVNPTDTLIIPEDGRDAVVAGVNYLANLFLKRSEEAQAWAQIYERLKIGASLI
jgi:hypothetical protein